MRSCLLRASEAAFPGRVAFLGCCEVGAVQAFRLIFLSLHYSGDLTFCVFFG